MKKPLNITENDWELLKQKYITINKKLIKKINKGYPVQYLIGNVDFFDCHISLNKHVLIPRFETELLVEKAIKKISEYFEEPIKIVDFGTGSGCIAIKLASVFKKSKVIAIDKSKQAIKLAKKNAELNKVNIEFYTESFKNFDQKGFDILISNPPYISKRGQIEKKVKKYEPSKALFAKKAGLFYFEQILVKTKKIMKEKNIIFFEIGSDQKAELIKIIKKYYPESKVEIAKDFNNLDRFCIIINGF